MGTPDASAHQMANFLPIPGYRHEIFGLAAVCAASGVNIATLPVQTPSATFQHVRREP
jgi:hypothetical protein